MGRTPDGINARTKVFTMRATPAWLALVDAQASGDPSSAAYIRRLVEEDRRRIARDKAARTTGRTP